MVRKLVLTLIAVLGVFAMSEAQTRRVSGTVTSADGSPVVGASVIVEGTTNGTTTEVNGRYTVSAPANGTLTISFVGFESQTVAISGRTTVDVVLKEDTQNIDDVVVIGYGSGSKIGTTLGSVSTVKAEELENKPAANVIDAIQGKVAGLQIYTSSGEPSATSSMRLHGVGSLEASTSPLLVIDGVPTDAGQLISLNPNDIESFNVLKDASATSIYGSRAANGVIYIATKRGRRNEPITVTARAQYGISQAARSRTPMMNTAELAQYMLDTGEFDQDDYNEIMNAGIDTDWRNYFYSNHAPTYQFDLSATGGTEKTSFFMSGSYLKKEGTAPRSDYERYGMRSNLDFTANKWLRMGMNFALGFDRRETAYSTTNGVANPAFAAILHLPWISPYDENGDDIETISSYSNPVYYAKKFPSNSKNLTLNGAAYIQLTPVKGLNIKSQLGVDSWVSWSEAMRLASYSGSFGNGQVVRSHDNGATITSTTTIDYNFDFSNPCHKLYLLAGQEGIRYDYLAFSAGNTGQVNDKAMMISSGSSSASGRSVSDSSSAYAFCSWFGRAEYSYADKYVFDASVRRDASSRFGINNRAGVFYAFGGLWNAKKEDFLRDSRAVTDLSVKLSYGTQGNAGIDNYASLYTLGSTTYQGSTGWALSGIGNPNLGWETQKLFTLAANVEFIDRIRLEAEFYNRLTEDMLMAVPLPYTTGYTERYENVGSLRNRGIDLSVDIDVVKTKDWYFGVHANFNYNKAEIIRLFNGYTEYPMPSYNLCYAIGHDAAEFYMEKWAGIDPADGSQMWEVVDPTTGEISLTKDYNEATPQLTGKSRYAPLSGGFGFNASWKGLSIGADFSWISGKYMVNNARFFWEEPTNTGSFNKPKYMANFWRQPGDITDIPRFDYDQYPEFDSHMLEDASFLRLKNLTVSYDFPKSVIGKSGFIKGLRIYFVGRNLLTFTKYTGFDPEVDTNIDLGRYPNTREFVGGVEFTF